MPQCMHVVPPFSSFRRSLLSPLHSVLLVPPFRRSAVPPFSSFRRSPLSSLPPSRRSLLSPLRSVLLFSPLEYEVRVARPRRPIRRSAAAEVLAEPGDRFEQAMKAVTLHLPSYGGRSGFSEGRYIPCRDIEDCQCRSDHRGFLPGYVLPRNLRTASPFGMPNIPL